MPRPTRGRECAYPYRAITVYGAPFQTLPVRTIRATGLVRVRSPLLAESLLMSFPPATEMFQFAGFAPYGYGFTARCRRSGGLPHSEIPGSALARNSPRLIAACYVLHRLSVPRHPPNALAYLIPCARCQMRAWPIPQPPTRAERIRAAALDAKRRACETIKSTKMPELGQQLKHPGLSQSVRAMSLFTIQ